MPHAARLLDVDRAPAAIRIHEISTSPSAPASPLLEHAFPPTRPSTPLPPPPHGHHHHHRSVHEAHDRVATSSHHDLHYEPMVRPKYPNQEVGQHSTSLRRSENTSLTNPKAFTAKMNAATSLSGASLCRRGISGRASLRPDPHQRRLNLAHTCGSLRTPVSGPTLWNFRAQVWLCVRSPPEQSSSREKAK
jgi:hypothetical protein